VFLLASTFLFRYTPRPNGIIKIMKKTFLAVLLILLWTVASVAAAELKVGDSAAGFKLKDPKGVEYSLDSPQYKGKVVVVFYGDPGSKDLNNDLQNALKSAREAGKIDKKNYEGLGIVNLKDSMVPNFMLKSIIKSKQEETKAVILMDPDYAVLNLWGLTKKTSNIIMLDKQRICRYLYKGKVPQADIARVIGLIQEFQVK
jgi:predicted transcriptional regulator